MHKATKAGDDIASLVTIVGLPPKDPHDDDDENAAT
jgi:hypothetical protein